jgi:hypothetical protein
VQQPRLVLLALLNLRHAASSSTSGSVVQVKTRARAQLAHSCALTPGALGALPWARSCWCTPLTKACRGPRPAAPQARTSRSSSSCSSHSSRSPAEPVGSMRAMRPVRGQHRRWQAARGIQGRETHTGRPSARPTELAPGPQPAAAPAQSHQRISLCQ